MKERLQDIIKFKTKGKQNEFATLMGWSTAYLAKLLAGGSFGLKPVIAILAKFPEIDARWFLLGEGCMISDVHLSKVRRTMHTTMSKVLELEKYMKVMSPEELREFEDIVLGKKEANFSPATVSKWEELLQEQNNEVQIKFDKAKKQ